MDAGLRPSVLFSFLELKFGQEVLSRVNPDHEQNRQSSPSSFLFPKQNHTIGCGSRVFAQICCVTFGPVAQVVRAHA